MVTVPPTDFHFEGHVCEYQILTVRHSSNTKTQEPNNLEAKELHQY